MVLTGLSFVAGLLRKMTLGLSVTVWVKLVCPCTFFDSLVGHSRRVLLGSLITWIPSLVSALCSVVGRLARLCTGVLMPRCMASDENSVLLRNTIF